MIRSFNGKTPSIAPSAYVSQAALVIGDVEIGEDCGVWPFAVIRGDSGRVRIGKNSHVAEHALVVGAVEIGESSIIGFSAVADSCKVGREVFVGTHATILKESEVGDNAIVGANAVIRQHSRVPARCLATGVPAHAIKVLSLEQCQKILADSARDLASLAKQYKEQGL
ncbi:MAG: gamma carbonic anhydrase family protein [Chloroflexi bacterium]|nr:gamma carbonic anhydrase family protein [Chloroflexota bacterium]